jgi:FMN phosphatase YigB (HAD superfamily)
MNIRPPVKGIIFDLDGTLYRMPWYMKPLITARLFPHCLRLPAYMSVRETFSGKNMDSGESLMQALGKGLSNKIPSLSAGQARKWIEEKFYRQFEAVMPLFRNSRPGLSKTLSRCNLRGIKLAVLSDFDRIENRLLALGISPSLFNVLMAAESEGCLKPSPKPFLSIAQKWDIAPSNILVVGDRADTDGLAAKGAGMQFMRITDSRKHVTDAYSWMHVRGILEGLSS